MESGFSWLPTLLRWRTNRSWRGVRTEVPWIDRAPADIVRDHVRFTLQPLDVPNADVLNRVFDHVRSDELILFSTDVSALAVRRRRRRVAGWMAFRKR